MHKSSHSYTLSYETSVAHKISTRNYRHTLSCWNTMKCGILVFPKKGIFGNETFPNVE